MGRFDKFISDQTEEEPVPAGTPRITVTPAPGGGRFQEFTSGLPQPEAPKNPWANFNKPSGELKPADVTPSQQAKWSAISALVSAGHTPQRAQDIVEKSFDIGSTLTPMGAILSAADFTYHAPKAVSGERKLANTADAALDVLGAIPGVSYARRGYHALRGTPGRIGGVPEVIPAHTAPFRETRRAEPEIGGFVTPLPSEARTAGREGYRAIEQAPLVYHPNAMAEMTDVARNALPNPRIGTGVFTPEGAPNTHAMLERFGLAFPRGGARPVNAWDFDTLRQGLLSQKGVEAAAGRQATDILDTYMLRPPPGMIVRGQELLPGLEQEYLNARGNWRGYKTGGAVESAIDAARIGAAGEHSGKNLGNRQRQAFQQYIKTPEGEAKLFGATPAQLDRIEDVAAGDPWTNALRAGSNRLGGGGGIGQTGVAGIGASAGAGAGALIGGPWGAAVGAPVGAAIPSIAGGMMRGAANRRTAEQGQQVAHEIMQSTPLYRQNLAAAEARGMGPMADPRIRARDAITMALMPGMRDTGQNWVDEVYTPYQYR